MQKKCFEYLQCIVKSQFEMTHTQSLLRGKAEANSKYCIDPETQKVKMYMPKI